jgi:hypothetical protein
MKERTGGSITIKDGKIVDRTDPPKIHPEGNRSRDAQGRARDAVEAPAAVVADEVKSSRSSRRATPEIAAE